MHRLGMTFDHEAQIVDDGLTFDAVVYSITRAQWLTGRPPTQNVRP
jgi:hypothetical protein